MSSDSSFPPLEFGDGIWEGKDILPSWAGTQSRQGPYTSIDLAGQADGTIPLNIVAPGGEEESRPPASEQATGYTRLKREEATITQTLLRALLDYARGLDEAYEVPRDLDLESLKGMVGLGNVHVLAVAREGEAYVGFELGCDWDEEHGCGVMTHRGRVVSVGQAEEAFEEWIAKRDGGKDLD